MRFGLLFEGVVVEVIDLPPNRTLADMASDDVDNYITIPPHVGEGFSRTPDGEWLPPGAIVEKYPKVKETAS